MSKENKKMKKDNLNTNIEVGIDLTSDGDVLTNAEDNPRLHVSLLEKELQESNDKYIRLAAEFENYKKRVQKDKEELVSNTKVKMLQSILDMDNDLNFAIKSSPELGEGVKLIVSKLETFLKSQGIETIQTDNYDEDLHEVISVLPADETKVIDVVGKGYTLNGKPFRYPKIILGKSNA
jgi:molecular chaperone GrpE